MPSDTPNFLVKIEIRANTREQAARWLREMAATMENSPTFRSSSAAGATWSVELSPAAHAREGNS